MHDFAKEWMPDNDERIKYNIFSRGCLHFMKDVINAGDVDMPSMIDLRPNSYIDEIREEYKNLNYDYKINKLE